MRSGLAILTFLTILTFAATCFAADSTESHSGYYQVQGVIATGVGDELDFGYAFGLGKWFTIKGQLFSITPVTLEVDMGEKTEGKRALVSFNPQTAIKVGRFIFSGGSGVTQVYGNGTTYWQIDSGLTFILSDIKSSWVPNAEITFACRYIPDLKLKTFMIGLTAIN